MKIMMTGGTGFIGSHLVNRLAESGADLTLLKRSTSDTWRIQEALSKITCFDLDCISFEDLFTSVKPDIIIHFAANQGRQGDRIDKMIQDNVIFPSNLLEKAIQFGLKCFINTDTSASDHHSLYATTKKAFLPVLNHFHTKSELSIINFELEYVYGPKDDETKFIPYLIDSILSEKTIDASPGTQKRDFIFVQDVVEAYGKAIDLAATPGIGFLKLPLGSGQTHTLKEFAAKATQLAGVKQNINWGALNFRKGDILFSEADISETSRQLDWQPGFDLSKGLQQTIEWYKEQAK